jgi:transposase InsO family protein
MYDALGITKQSYHQKLDRWQKRESMTHQVIHMVHQVRVDHPTMGVRDIYFKLQPSGLGRDAFEAICHAAGLMSMKHKNRARTTDSSGVIRFEDLTKGLQIGHMDQVWQSDITYFEVKGRFYYLTFIQDVHTKMIVGHSTSKSLSTEDTTLPALRKAISRRNRELKGLIIHSDGGGQYYCKKFLEVTRSKEMKNSMCEHPWENGTAERLNGVIKNQYLKHRQINGFEDLKREVDRSVQLYNCDKPHKALKRKTPEMFEKELLILLEQPEPKMTKSFDAKCRSEGASSPLPIEATKASESECILCKLVE